MEKSVLVVGVDDSNHSFHALEWTLQQFFSIAPDNSPYKLVIVNAIPFARTAAGYAGPAAAWVPSHSEMEVKVIAERILEKAKEICAAKSTDFFTLVNLLNSNRCCGAVLGSVSDYCARHAHCSVMIVKMPSKIRGLNRLHIASQMNNNVPNDGWQQLMFEVCPLDDQFDLWPSFPSSFVFVPPGWGFFNKLCTRIVCSERKRSASL